MIKKIGLTMVVAACLFATSCKKDYTCTCITKVSGYGLDETTTSTNTLQNMTKKDAESSCNALETNVSSFGFTTSSTCVLE